MCRLGGCENTLNSAYPSVLMFEIGSKIGAIVLAALMCTDGGNRLVDVKQSSAEHCPFTTTLTHRSLTDTI